MKFQYLLLICCMGLFWMSFYSGLKADRVIFSWACIYGALVLLGAAIGYGVRCTIELWR